MTHCGFGQEWVLHLGSEEEKGIENSDDIPLNVVVLQLSKCIHGFHFQPSEIAFAPYSRPCAIGNEQNTSQMEGKGQGQEREWEESHRFFWRGGNHVCQPGPPLPLHARRQSPRNVAGRGTRETVSSKARKWANTIIIENEQPWSTSVTVVLGARQACLISPFSLSFALFPL